MLSQIRSFKIVFQYYVFAMILLSLCTAFSAAQSDNSRPSDLCCVASDNLSPESDPGDDSERCCHEEVVRELDFLPANTFGYDYQAADTGTTFRNLASSLAQAFPPGQSNPPEEIV